ncbi:MAG TPA: hypothetical protein VFW22_05340 [Pseudolabrys sp.]|nr:hypothetical protein [Pseudolabrys sp.]
MRRKYRVLLIASSLALMPALAGCADFDMDNFDFLNLNQKKKLPGERKEVFPGGVPGVTQGIPPEYMKGNQPPPDTALAPDAAAPPPAAKTAAIAPAEEPKPKAKPKPKPRAAKPAPTRVTVQPVAQGQGTGEQKLEPWPAAAPAGQQQPAPAQGNDPWLSAPPPPSTMSR